MVVGQRYRLDRELGVGGSATVWLAHDLFTDSPCAVKWLLPDPRGGQARRERMRGEVRALQSLTHRHVIRVLDVGEHEDRDYLVMEHLDGGSLADRVEHQGPLPPAEAVELVLQILDALSAAHAAGIVHRDVKPANVLLRGDGTAVLCDFGIARREDLAGETRTGMALGSVAYMAPEQRIDARRVAPAADLYAAACTLFNLVTGETPIDLYLAPDHSPRWEGVPAPLRPVVRRGTRVEIAERFHDADEMRAALNDVLPGLRAVPAQPRPRVFVTPSHVPTRVDEPAAGLSLDAGRRGSIEAQDWGWVHRRSGAGRPALWVGTAILAIVTAVGLVTGPLADSAAPELALAPAPAIVAPSLTGSWVGTLGAARRADLVLSGTADRLTGDLVVRLGHHEVRSTVVGRWDSAAGELVLEEQGGAEAPVAVWRARPSSSGLVLEGAVARSGADAPLPFAFVRMD
jgi:hypothetical protein